MWKELFQVIQELFGLRKQVKQHDENLIELAGKVHELALAFNLLSERVLRVELKQEFHEKQTAADIENLRLRLENILLRFERRLPAKTTEEDKESDEPKS